MKYIRSKHQKCKRNQKTHNGKKRGVFERKNRFLRDVNFFCMLHLFSILITKLAALAIQIIEHITDTVFISWNPFFPYMINPNPKAIVSTFLVYRSLFKTVLCHTRV